MAYDGATAERIRRLLAEAPPDPRRALRPELEASGALEYAWQRAREYAARAAAALDPLAESDTKSVLKSLAHHVVRRAS